MSDSKPLFQCTLPRETLLHLVVAAGRAVPAKPIVSLLDNLKLDCSSERIRVTGYDLQFAIEAATTEPLTGAEGACEVLIKRDRLESLLNAMAFEELVLRVSQDYTVTLADAAKPEKTFFKLSGQAATDYPGVQAHREVVAPDVTLRGDFFRRLVELTRFATSYNDVRLYFNGVLLTLAGQHAIMVGTDGFRMAVVERELESPVKEEIKAIIPSKALQEMARLLPHDRSIVLSFGRREEEGKESIHMQSLRVEWEGFLVTFRLIDSAYPDWKRVLPKENKGSATFTKNDLLPMIRSLLALTKQGQEIEKAGLVTLKVEDGVLSGTSKTQTGEGQYETAVQQEGTGVSITFDGRYLLDLFGAVGDVAGEQMVFSYADSLKQGVFTFPEDDGFRYVLMPIRQD